MNKKTLLLSGLLALAATPLLIAQNVTDIFIFGNDSISGGQKVNLTNTQPQGTNTWNGTGTSVKVTFQNQSSNLNVSFPARLNEDSWNEQGNVAKAFLETTNKSSKTDFSGIKNGLYSYGSGTGSGPQVRFQGFSSGQEYEVGFWIKTGQGASNPNLQISDLSSGISGVVCYYGLLSGTEFTKGEKSITLSGQNNQYFVKYSFTAGSNSQLALSFNAVSSGAASVPTFDIGLIAISAVPEPSAFGLLAGLGSVVLAASRRRRRR